jgi:hypothetical protein
MLAPDPSTRERIDMTVFVWGVGCLWLWFLIRFLMSGVIPQVAQLLLAVDRELSPQMRTWVEVYAAIEKWGIFVIPIYAFTVWWSLRNGRSQWLSKFHLSLFVILFAMFTYMGLYSVQAMIVEVPEAIGKPWFF